MGPSSVRGFTEQVTFAKVKPGDWIYTSLDPSKPEPGLFIVEAERPSLELGKPRKVAQNVSEKGKGRYLLFEDATRTTHRNGTALAYRYLLNGDGNPLPTPTYPPCPTCGSTGPSCKTKAGDYASWHAKRPTTYAEVDPTPKLSESRKSELGLHDGERVEVRADGRIYIKDWQHPEGSAGVWPIERVTSKGRRLHIWPSGWVEVVDAKAEPKIVAPKTKVPTHLHATDEQADAKLAEGSPETGGDRCDQCKGFGVVRKRGPRAGQRYKTFAGALAAKENGNAVVCPKCKGEAVVAA